MQLPVLGQELVLQVMAIPPMDDLAVELFAIRRQFLVQLFAAPYTRNIRRTQTTYSTQIVATVTDVNEITAWLVAIAVRRNELVHDSTFTQVLWTVVAVRLPLVWHHD